MKINLEWIINLDLIGVELYAKSKHNPTWTVFKSIGKCLDETKFTLKTQVDNSTKIFIKDQYYFQFWFIESNGTRKLLEFDGSKIVGRPEQKIKQIRKKIHKKYH